MNKHLSDMFAFHECYLHYILWFMKLLHNFIIQYYDVYSLKMILKGVVAH